MLRAEALTCRRYSWDASALPRSKWNPRMGSLPSGPSIFNWMDSRHRVPPPTQYSASHEMESAVSFLKLSVRLAGNLCGVPGVSVLADAVVVLIETCENIPKQRQVSSVHALLARQLMNCPGRMSRTCRSDAFPCLNFSTLSRQMGPPCRRGWKRPSAGLSGE